MIIKINFQSMKSLFEKQAKCPYKEIEIIVLLSYLLKLYDSLYKLAILRDINFWESLMNTVQPI